VKAGTRKAGSLYVGVIRDGGHIVWECSHLHRNRDMSPGVRQSARDCAALTALNWNEHGGSHNRITPLHLNGVGAK